ncbi:MAG: DUF4253 domain-containing protein [Rubrivivax sp.]|nr:MAG: DUF4253 domain-containing protein [Rubrivivax sp.]
MSLFKKIFDRFSTSPDDAPPASEHAVLIRFHYGRADLSGLYALEDEMTRVVADAGVGEVDGHEVAVGGGDATIYAYGQDANALFRSIHPVLLDTTWLDEARVTLRYGPPEDGIAASEVTIRPLKFPFPVETMPGDRAVERWQVLRAEGGCTPVILGDLEDREQLREGWDIAEPDVDELLARAEAIDVDTWLREHDNAERLVEFSDGVWPAANQAVSTLRVPFSEDGTPRPGIGMAILPTSRHWEAAAWLRFGGWNACPAPEDHVALWRSWAERHGAQVACITGSVVEFVVDRPPATADEALALAREHFLYCDDLVIQGYGTLEGLAAALLDAPVWSFWWD